MCRNAEFTLPRINHFSARFIVLTYSRTTRADGRMESAAVPPLSLATVRVRVLPPRLEGNKELKKYFLPDILEESVSYSVRHPHHTTTTPLIVCPHSFIV